MARFFFGQGGNTYPRTLSHGYTTLELDESATSPSILQYHTDEDALVVQGGGVQDNIEHYTFMCKEFGVYGYKDRTGISAKVSIIFCDDGWMMVTLLDGTILLNYDDQIIQPTTGERTKYPAVIKNNIYWVNQDILMEHKAYFGSKFACVNIQDFEYVLQLSGGVYGGLGSFSMKVFPSEYVDLSRGYTAMLEEQERKKEMARNARKVVAAVSSDIQRTVQFAFDEDDEEEDDVELEFEEDEGEIIEV